MNFIDYCIYTKNYSTLKCIGNYNKLFSEDDAAHIVARESPISDFEHGLISASPYVGAGAGGLLGYKVADLISKGREAKGKKPLGVVGKGLITAGGALHGLVAGPLITGGAIMAPRVKRMYDIKKQQLEEDPLGKKSESEEDHTDDNGDLV